MENLLEVETLDLTIEGGDLGFLPKILIYADFKISDLNKMKFLNIYFSMSKTYSSYGFKLNYLIISQFLTPSDFSVDF